MPCRRACVLVVVMFAMGAGAWVGEAHAQPAWGVNEARGSRWTIGLSAGLWGPAQPADETGRSAGRSGAIDFSIQRQIDGMWNHGGDGHGAIRLQVGRGNRYNSRDEGSFDYRRVMLGAFREFCIPLPRAPTFIHVGGGFGAYRIRSASERLTKASVFAQAGFDVQLGSSALTLGPELQVHTIGERFYGTTSIVARILLP